MPSGSAGEVDFPDYMEAMFRDFVGGRTVTDPLDHGTAVTKSLVELLNEDIIPSTGNPYYNETAYNLTTGGQLSSIDSQVAKVVSVADNFSYTDYMDSISSDVKSKADSFYEVSTMLSNLATTLAQAASEAGAQFSTSQVASEADISSMISTFVSNASTKVNSLMSSADVTTQNILSGVMGQVMSDIVSVFDSEGFQYLLDVLVEKTNPEFYKLLNEYSGLMVESGIYGTSGFQIGMALMISKRHSDLNNSLIETTFNNIGSKYIELYGQMMKDYFNNSNNVINNQTQLYSTNITSRLSDLAQRIAVYAEGYSTQRKSVNNQAALMTQLSQGLLTTQIETLLKATSMQYDSKLNNLRAHVDEKNRNIELDVAYAKWSWDIYQWYANIFASIHGSIGLTPDGMSKTQSTLAGAASGAAVGTSISPGMGTAIGAGIGAVAGYFSN